MDGHLWRGARDDFCCYRVNLFPGWLDPDLPEPLGSNKKSAISTTGTLEPVLSRVDMNYTGFLSLWKQELVWSWVSKG